LGDPQAPRDVIILDEKLGLLTADVRLNMEPNICAPLLSRIKSWQLVWLGISGWVTLYSVAIIFWGASSFIVGNSQGGCFATAMTLAGVEVKRVQKGNSIPLDPLQWTDSITTEQLNQTLKQSLKKQEILVESLNSIEANMGFGLRAVNAGRTLVFETGRWKDPVIDLLHAKTTEENRSKIRADVAIIVGAGKPDEDTQIFVKAHPLKLLVGKELKEMFDSEKSPIKNGETMSSHASDVNESRVLGDMV
jgi:hypothetical protein